MGEWSSPEFVAKYVKAEQKSVWIHNDLSKAEYFDIEEHFKYFEYFDKYIFVSKQSMKAGIEKYPFLKGKSLVIYNISDIDQIKKLSSKSIECSVDFTLPTLLTCANFRPQKNHLRQIEVMKILFDRGLKFNWINIGALYDKSIVRKFEILAEQYGIKQYCHILGPKQNPFKYMSKATAVTVFSDYESWSMVIAEAKILGIPVISTKTSGALEQLEHHVNGVLTNFSDTDIADKIEEFLTDTELQKKIKNNIKNFDNTQKILNSFIKLIEEPNLKYTKIRKPQINRILYIMDAINYLGGAHIATKLQINLLKQRGADVTIFSHQVPSVLLRHELPGIKFLSWHAVEIDAIYNSRLVNVILDKKISWRKKLLKLKMLKDYRFYGNDISFKKHVFPDLLRLFSTYDTICIMSESSSFKKIIAKCSVQKKIQWLHTDYCNWIKTNPYFAETCKDDGEIWKNYDKIIVLAEKIKQNLSTLYPHLRDKIEIIKNIIPVDLIKEKSKFDKGKKQLRFLSAGRIDNNKIGKLIPTLSRLKSEKYSFYWYIVGGGEKFDTVNYMIKQYNLEDCVSLEGTKINPLPSFDNIDVFALLSDYEGLPNVIYESLILGVPVIATNVGGINEQVIPGETGWLVENNKDAIYEGIKHLFDHPEEIKVIKEKLKNYSYDNEKIFASVYKLFGL